MPSTVTSILDGLSTSVAVKAPCRTATTANITLSGLQTVGGVALAEDDRVLVKDQTVTSQNGIYAASTGSWTRTKDFDGNRDVRNGTLVLVENSGTNIYYRVTTANPIVIGTSSIVFELVAGAVTQGTLGQALYPITAAEAGASVTPVSYFYESSVVSAQGTNVLRDIASNQIASIIAGDASSQTASTVDDGLQAALNASRQVNLPSGTYAVATPILIRPWSKVSGSSEAEYVASLNEAATGTRLIQTTANFLISTNIGPDLNAAYPGHILIKDLTLLGGTSASQIGTYGIRAESSNSMMLERVKAEWFTLAGFRFTGSLIPTINNCEANYNQDSGIRLDLGALGVAETSNSYGARITNCKIHQNKDAGIRLGDSTVRVSIRDCDIESTGSFFAAGLGYGLYIAGEARTVLVDGCWFEGNKRHIVVGVGDSAVTVPKNTYIRSCQFWSTNGGGAKIVLNSGRDTIIDSCEFLGGGTITLNSLADNPVIRNCFGNPTVIDSNSNNVAVDNQDMTNNLPTPAISSWTLTNCTVAEELVEGPAGPVAVYKVTPSATGFVRIAAPETPMSFLTARQTIGCYVRTDGSNTRVFDWSVTSTTMGKSYTDSTVDNFRVGSKWEWHSIGRHIDFADTGNQSVFLSVTVTTTDPFYITGMSARSGICYLPYKMPGQVVLKRQTVTYSASMTFSAAAADVFVTTATSTAAFTINNPTNPVTNKEITLVIRNTAGAALGAITWGAAFKQNFSAPANGNNRTVKFIYDGTNWVQSSGFGTDVPN